MIHETWPTWKHWLVKMTSLANISHECEAQRHSVCDGFDERLGFPLERKYTRCRRCIRSFADVFIYRIIVPLCELVAFSAKPSHRASKRRANVRGGNWTWHAEAAVWRWRASSVIYGFPRSRFGPSVWSLLAHTELKIALWATVAKRFGDVSQHRPEAARSEPVTIAPALQDFRFLITKVPIL